MRFKMILTCGMYLAFFSHTLHGEKREASAWQATRQAVTKAAKPITHAAQEGFLTGITTAEKGIEKTVSAIKPVQLKAVQAVEKATSAITPSFLKPAQATLNKKLIALLQDTQHGRWAVENVNLILGSGADPNAADDTGVPALSLVIQNEYFVTALLEKGGKALDYSIKKTLLDLLLDAGANTNATDKQGQTPLMYIAQGWGQGQSRSDRWEIAQALIDHKADVNATDHAGKTALIHALEYRNFDFAYFLIDHGAAVTVADKNKRTPLMYAVEKNHHDIVALLINKKASVNTVNDKGESALFGIAHTPVTPWNEYLSERRIYGREMLDARGPYVQEMTGIIDTQVAIANLLLDNGADPQIVNNHHQTFLHARLSQPVPEGMQYGLEDYYRKGTTAIAQAAIAKGFKDVADDEGKTVLMLAKKQGFSDIANALKKTSG